MNIINKYSNLSLPQKLFGFFLLALILRFLSYYTNPYLNADSILYLSINFHDMNGQLNEGLKMHSQLPPAMIYFMRVFNFFGINVEIGYRVTSIFFYSFVVFSLFYIAKMMISEKAALFVAFCYAVHPTLIICSHAILRETLSIPFLFFGLSFFLMCLKNKSLLFAILAGVCFAISYMARLEYGIALFGAFTLLLIGQCFKWVKLGEDKRLFWKTTLIALGSMFCLLFIVNIQMKQYDSVWDPFAYRKVKGFFLRAFE
jgi:4-amino-4-deoxy-L-arabinose transferase-like glycosyltransferase